MQPNMIYSNVKQWKFEFNFAIKTANTHTLKLSHFAAVIVAFIYDV